MSTINFYKNILLVSSNQSDKYCIYLKIDSNADIEIRIILLWNVKILIRILGYMED